MRTAFVLALVLLFVAPAAAETPIDFSWTVLTEFNPRDGGGLLGGTVGGRDLAAMWDGDAGTLRFRDEGDLFGGTFLHTGDQWNGPMTVPTHPDYLRASGGQSANTLVQIRETATGITVSGGHGSMVDFVRFSGTGSLRTVSAPEPAAIVALAALGLGAAAVIRRGRR